MSKILYVGIAGQKQAGKDTWALYLGQQLLRAKLANLRRRSFADALKQEVAAFVGAQITGSPRADASPWRNEAAVLECLYSDDPREKEAYRLLMQWWGTEFRRCWFGSDYWVRRLEDWTQTVSAQPMSPLPLVVLVPDVRFPNEADFIREQGGLLVRLRRPGLKADSHASETALLTYPHWDWHYLNNADLASMKADIEPFIQDRLLPALDR